MQPKVQTGKDLSNHIYYNLLALGLTKCASSTKKKTMVTHKKIEEVDAES
jgi:hypothetical protein